MCYKSGIAGALFISTGLAVTIQAAFVSLVVNEAAPNQGLRGVMPKSDGNRMRYTSRDPTVKGSPLDLLSLISIGGDCMDMLDNPTNRTMDASGHMRSDAPDKTFLNVGRVLSMSPGLYAVCFRQGTQTWFFLTGITVEIQNIVVALVVNSVSSMMANVPKTVGNKVAYCLEKDCLQNGLDTDRLSFIGADLSCSDMNHNPEVGSVDKSGYLAPVKDTRVLQSSEVDILLNGERGILGSRVFQACFSRGGSFFTTGLTLRVHDEILGLITNGIMPHNGLRTALPNSTGAIVAYYRNTQGIVGEALSLIWDQTENRKCDLFGKENNPLTPTNRASGIWTATTTSRDVQGADSVAGMMPGLYQLCFRSKDSIWRATGLSVTVQSAVTAVEINTDGATQRATILKGIGNAIALTGDAQLTSALSGSLVASRGECNDKDNWNTEAASRSASGRDTLGLFIMSPGFNTAIPMRDYLLASSKTILPSTYQFCLKTDVGWIETGIAITVKWACETSAFTTSFDLVYAHETSSAASLSSVISIVLKSALPVLPEGGVLVMRGLKGSLTPDTDSMEVQGGSISENQHQRKCLGKKHCAVNFVDYLASGRMLISATLSIAIKCTDLDSSGEEISSLLLNGRSILQNAEKGPWHKCASACNVWKKVVVDFPVSLETGVSGKGLLIDLSVSDEVQEYKCDDYLLNAEVTLTVVESHLGTHSLSGTWDQLNGELNLPDTPYMDSSWMHLTFVLRNPADQSQPRIPTVAVCALSKSAPAILDIGAQILHSSVGVLSARTQGAFTSFYVEQSTLTERVANTISIVLQTNLASLLPDVLSITISGLTNTLSPELTDLSLLSTDSGRFFDTSECVGGLSCHQKISLACMSCGKLHVATLDVVIFCTDFDAADGSKYIDYIRVCRGGSSTATESHCAPNSYMEIPPDAYSRGPWQGCGGCSLSTRTVLQNYNMANFIAAFGVEMIIEIGASAGVSGLFCYESHPEVRSIRAALNVHRIYAVQTAIWTGFRGEVIFNPNSAIMKCSFSDISQNAPCLPELRFDIELLNPIGVRAGSSLKADAQGGGLTFSPVTFEPVLNTVAAAAISVLEATLQQVTQIRGDAPRSRGRNRLSL